MAELMMCGKLTQLTPTCSVETAGATITKRHLVIRTNDAKNPFVTFDLWNAACDACQDMSVNMPITVYYRERPVVYDLPGIGFKSFVLMNVCRVTANLAPPAVERPKVLWAAKQAMSSIADEDNPLNW